VDSDLVNRLEAAIDQALACGRIDQAEALAMNYCRRASQDNTDGEPVRSPRFRSAYLAAQVALAAGRLRQALECLTPLLAVAGRLPSELAARLRLFAAEALARLRSHSEARELLNQVPASLLRQQPLLHLRALRIRLWLGEVANLAADLDRCTRSLEQQGETANLALLVCEEGRAWDTAHDLARAEQCWQRAERLSQSLGADPIRADVLLQLGRLGHLRGHLASALNRFDAALNCSPSAPQRLELRLRRLLVRLDMNQWEPARAEADQLLRDTPPEQLPEEVQPLAGMVRALLFSAEAADFSDELHAYQAAARGDAAAARDLYQRALAASPSPQRQARLALALGLLATDTGDPQEADSWLRRAEELARTLDLPEVLGRTLQARGQLVAESGGDEEHARRLFEEAVLIAETQAGQFSHGVDAAAYRQKGATVLRHLLRAACRRGDAASVFRYQELERGRLLLDLWRAAAGPSQRAALFDRADLTDLEGQIAACLQRPVDNPGSGEEKEQRRTPRRLEELQLERDRLLEEYLRDRSRRASAALPELPELTDLQRALPPGTLYLAPTVVDDEALYLLAVSREGPPRVLCSEGSAAGCLDALAQWRGCLTTQLARYQRGFPLGPAERAELDDRLADLHRGPLGDVLSQALDQHRSPGQRLVWVPDGPLHGLPLHALRHRGRYLIEDLEVVGAFSGALVVYQARTRRQTRGRFRPAVVVTEVPAVLPEAAREGQAVAASFLWSRTLHGGAATRAALRRWLARARVVHFACHAHFDSEHPLAAAVGLPSGELLRALEWLDEPVAGLPLVTLSACRSAEVAPLLGREAFGLVTGLLGGGVRAVLAGLWPVADREALPLMGHFYRFRLTHDLATALALAQRAALNEAGGSPLFWAAFALFGDAAALPAPARWWRWLARRRQRRHAAAFAFPPPPTAP
jgi:tetratricopeptide (TPR) repeat protein